MTASITGTAFIGMTPTETNCLFIKVETAYVSIFERLKRGKKTVNYSYDYAYSIMIENSVISMKFIHN